MYSTDPSYSISYQHTRFPFGMCVTSIRAASQFGKGITGNARNMLFVKRRTRRVSHIYYTQRNDQVSERGGWTIARLVTDRSSSCRIHTTTGTHTHTTHTYTRTRMTPGSPIYRLVPGAKATYPCGREYKYRLVGVLFSNRF